MNNERLQLLTKRYTSTPVRWRFDGKFAGDDAFAEVEHFGDHIEVKIDKRLLEDAHRHHLAETVFHEIAHVVLGHVRPRPAVRRFETVDELRQAATAQPLLKAAVRRYESNEESADAWAARELAAFEREHGDFITWVTTDEYKSLSERLDTILERINAL